VIDRFGTLEQLRAAGLISAEEHRARRQANLGALLPQTHPLPAADLATPAPPTAEVAARLQALSQAAEARRVPEATARAERARILDALLPATAAPGGPAASPPADPAAAMAVLERHRGAGLITPEEFERERRAIGAPVTAADLPPPSKASGAQAPIYGAPAPPNAGDAAALGQIAPAAGKVGPPTPLQPRRSKAAP
jgi:hypothetical protein